MIELLLFTFGFGMGFMVFDFIFSKREKKLNLEKKSLISEIEKLNRNIKHLTGRLSFYTCYFAADIREFKIIENDDSFDIILSLVRASVPFREENVLIKRFYFKNDFDYAKLCAQELLNKLNSTN